MNETQIGLNDLSGEQKLLAECIGIEAYIKLCRMYGGSAVYVAKLDKLEIQKRNRQIYKEYTGCNLRALTVKYGLSEQQIRNIINEVRGAISEQLSLFQPNK